jgi:hypothetical protein
MEDGRRRTEGGQRQAGGSRLEAGGRPTYPGQSLSVPHGQAGYKPLPQCDDPRLRDQQPLAAEDSRLRASQAETLAFAKTSVRDEPLVDDRETR